MNKAKIPYQKLNFILSVIGFIGSMSFYIGVLRQVMDDAPEKQLIEELKIENEYLRKQNNKLNQTQESMDKHITYLDLFSGLGAFAKGLKNAGFEFKHHYFSEIDEYAIANYKYNFKNAIYAGDINKIQKINRPDLITFGSPCQNLSLAGRREGINGRKSGLFFKAIEIIDQYKPRVFVFENVSGLFSSNKGRDFEIVLQAIADLGVYECQWQLVNTTWFLPQNRERVYLVGCLGEESGKQIFPLRLPYENQKTPERKVNVIGQIGVSQTGRIFDAKRFSPTLMADHGFSHGYVEDKGSIRRLTPVEGERLQGLPDNWTRYGIFNGAKEVIPEGQRYCLIGNAVSTPIVTEIAKSLIGSPMEINGITPKKYPEEEPLPKHPSPNPTPMQRATKETEEAKAAFIQWTKDNLLRNKKYTRIQTEKAGRQMGIHDKTLIKELTEFGIVEAARHIALKPGMQANKYHEIVDLYGRQVNLSFRTSQSILLNQYSTPAPIGYMMGIYCELDTHRKHAFEPSAGNGLLTIATYPKMVTVNEIDALRNENLKRSSYQSVTKQDASKPFPHYKKYFDAVVSNPPFGSLGRGEHVEVDGFRIYNMDHHMVILALDTMKDNGKGAFIIGGHVKYDELGRVKAGKTRIFLNYLYKHYNVEDIIPIDGKRLFYKQGTSFDTSLILINGRKKYPSGVAPLRKDSTATVVNSFITLYTRIGQTMRGQSESNRTLRFRALELEEMLKGGGTLEGPYSPSSKGTSLQTQVPDSMDFEMHQAVKRITEDVGGDMDNFVRHRLGYPTISSLHDSLSAEQIDAVGMSIYNIEALGQAMIIGDQTGIGKGRVAASMIRYANLQGVKPIFLTVGANLFSDIYRDLDAIGSAHLKPFIVNTRESKTDMKDEDGLVVYQAPTSIEQNRVFETCDLTGYDYVIATYSQFNSVEKKPTKPEFLKTIAQDSILIMDESHVASGSSNTGKLMQQVVRATRGATFLSATFAKRSDNMPIYGLKTAISESNMSREGLISAIENGGVALQEVLASQLVAEGQMIRRERTYEGIEVNYITLDALAAEHTAIADNITAILRDIIAFQSVYVDKRVSEMDEMLAEDGLELKKRGGTNNAGVDNVPYFSKIFNVINQMLFSIKAEAVADRAIERLKQGMKPVIAFSSTMGSFLEQLEDEDGEPAKVGQSVKSDFAVVLEKGLEGVMRYTVTAPDGSKDYNTFSPDELGPAARNEFDRIREEIRTISTGITVSPIDIIVQRIQDAGYKVGEVTGRKLKLHLSGEYGTVELRKRMNTNDAFRKFNNNELDVLLINQSGSTGASAHAVPTNKVPAAEVKQRVMIVLQPELDINIEIQKRGRVNRTGQIKKPVYDYMNSAIPAEKRLMMMLQKKLKSLDANTSSNQKQSSSILDVPDFLNKYGDSIVIQYLKENPELNQMLGDPVKISVSSSSSEKIDVQKEDAALKTSGRVAVLSAKMQEDFYNDIRERYDNLVAYFKQTGDYDLEVEEMDLKAKTVNSRVVIMGRGGHTSFGEDSFLETVEANVLRKPFKPDELKNILQQSLAGKTPEQVRDELVTALEEHSTKARSEAVDKIYDTYEELKRNVEQEAKIRRLKKENPGLVDHAIYKRREELDYLCNKKMLDTGALMDHRKQQIGEFFKYFTIGKRLMYPDQSFGGETVNHMAVFMGFKIDMKRSNPYVPSAIGLRFAIASSQKSIEIPGSYGVQINAIKGASMGVKDQGLDHTLYEWYDAIEANSKDRQVRFIITGNILQAFSAYRGKLVSYSTHDGKTEKGILMPEYWDAEKIFGGQVEVPISKTLNLFKSLVEGKQIDASHGITFFRVAPNMYRMIVNGTFREGGEVFLNHNVIKLTFTENFEKVGKNMSAHIEISDLSEMLQVLEDELGVSVKMTEQQIDNMGLIDRPVKPRVKIEAPPQPEKQTDKLKLLKLRARALELELQLLSFKPPKNKAS